MKKSSIVVMILVVLGVIGCVIWTTKKTEKIEKKYISYFSDDNRGVTFVKIKPLEYVERGEELPKETQDWVNLIGNGVCSYLNDTYNAGWKYEDIKTYRRPLEDVSQQAYLGMDIELGALYNKNGIILSDFIAEANDDVQRYYVVSHELLHYLFEYNCPDNKWMIGSKEIYVGEYFEEAIVDMLAKEYTLSIFPNADMNSFKSAYEGIRFCTEELKVMMPNYLQYFFKDDIEGFKKEFNDTASKYVEGNSERHCLKFLYTIDLQFKEACAGNWANTDKVMSIQLNLIAACTPKEKFGEFCEIGRNSEITIPNEYMKLMY